MQGFAPPFCFVLVRTWCKNAWFLDLYEDQLCNSWPAMRHNVIDCSFFNRRLLRITESHFYWNEALTSLILVPTPKWTISSVFKCRLFRDCRLNKPMLQPCFCLAGNVVEFIKAKYLVRRSAKVAVIPVRRSFFKGKTSLSWKTYPGTRHFTHRRVVMIFCLLPL